LRALKFAPDLKREERIPCGHLAQANELGTREVEL
jgi:hypothetical protein